MCVCVCVCVVAPGRGIWNLTVEPNSNYANVSWRHDFPADSSEFVLEFILESKNQTQFEHRSCFYAGQSEPEPGVGPNHPRLDD